MTLYTLIGGKVNEEEAAAAMAAVACLLDEEAAALAAPADDAQASGWQCATRLVTQGLLPTRMAVAPRWGTIERLRRAGRGGSGIVGQ